MRAHLLAIAFASSTSGVLLCARSAHADAVVSVHVMHGTNAWSGDLKASDEEPDVLSKAAPHLNGTTTTTEIGMQVAGLSSSTRFGFNESIFIPRDLTVHMSPLPREFSVEPGIAWGGRIEAFLGREFARIGPLTPWIDVSAGVSMLSASIKLRHGTLGGLGDTHYLKVDPIVAPRIGVRVPFSEFGVFEFMARRDVIGPGRFFLGVAVAVTIFNNEF